MASDSSLVNKTLITSEIRQEFGVIIVGIKKEDGQMHFNPEPTTLIVGGYFDHSGTGSN